MTKELAGTKNLEDLRAYWTKELSFRKIEIWNRLKQFLPMCIEVAFRTDWFFSSLGCTDNAQCTAKGDTGAKCTNDVIINGTKQPGTCSCTVAGYSTPDCSG